MTNDDIEAWFDGAAVQPVARPEGKSQTTRSGGRPAATDTGGKSGSDRTDSQEDGQAYALDAPTPEALAAKDSAQAERDKQAKDAEVKAKADAQRDDFVLTGSNRPADEAEARGQTGLFDTPASPNLSGQRVDFNPISFEDAAGVVATIRPTAQKIWNVDLRLFPTQSALPQDVQDAIAQDYGDAEVKGAVHKGAVYLIADQHESASDFEATILHEVMGHVGVRRLYGKGIVQELNQLFIAIGGERGLNRIAKRRGLQADLSGYAKALSKSEYDNEMRVRLMMEELLAHTVQAPKFSDRVKTLVGKVRAWLRDNGFLALAEMGETDLLHVLSQAKRALTNGKHIDGPVVLQAVWHGTPHIWAPEPGFPHGRPRLDKMGTGEGAQEFGWGFYTAEAKDVGIGYKNRLTGDIMKRQRDRAAAIAASKWYTHPKLIVGGKTYWDRMELQGDIASDRLGSMDMPGPVREAFVDALLEDDAGSLYKLDIPDATLPYLLDWGKPLSEQTKEVRDALDASPNTKARNGNTVISGATGSEVYEHIVAVTGSKKAASEYLASIGIVGNRYLDGQSRANGEGSYNYVIWDQPTLDKIALLERNGKKLDAIRFSKAQDDLQSDYEVQPNAPRDTPLDDNALRALRRAAAGIESPGKGITFRVDDAGRAIVTGPARVKVPSRFQKFADDNGLTLVVRRERGGFANSNAAMPLENRESGTFSPTNPDILYSKRKSPEQLSASPYKKGLCIVFGNLVAENTQSDEGVVNGGI